MVNDTLRHIENKLRSILVVIKRSSSAWFAIFLSILSGTYFLGQYIMAAQKDREMAVTITEYNMKIQNLEQQHRDELKEREKESVEWKERYFNLLLERADNRGLP